MPRYRVEISVKHITLLVDADDENDAVEIAEDQVLSGQSIDINESYATKLRWKTGDGFVLEWDGSHYTDGDLKFDANEEGIPVNSEGERLDGDFLDDEDDAATAGSLTRCADAMGYDASHCDGCDQPVMACTCLDDFLDDMED